MGCLNGRGQFAYWFGNIHLSGPCNRSCYFCIGQHMMALDGFNVRDTWPLAGWEEFVAHCRSRDVREVYVTGTNTDPLLYGHIEQLTRAVRSDIGARVGVRTNAAYLPESRLPLFDMGSVTICSLDHDIYRAMMGKGRAPCVPDLLQWTAHWRPALKVNIVLGPENRTEVHSTLRQLAAMGVERVNLREPYGQPHVGDPCVNQYEREGTRLGMPVYSVGGMDVVYWDVHYVEVESVNLYASGRVSETYPITVGHVEGGVVQDQSQFPGGRVREQWLAAAPVAGERAP